MTKNYYKNEYTHDELLRLIDIAVDYRCDFTHSPSERIITIDSTDIEDQLIEQSGLCCSRLVWADFIHNSIERYARTGIK